LGVADGPTPISSGQVRTTEERKRKEERAMEGRGGGGGWWGGVVNVGCLVSTSQKKDRGFSGKVVKNSVLGKTWGRVAVPERLT